LIAVLRGWTPKLREQKKDKNFKIGRNPGTRTDPVGGGLSCDETEDFRPKRR